MAREASLIIVAGVKKVGKTFQTIQLIQSYLTPTSSRKARKVLYFDINQEITPSAIKDAGCNFTCKALAVKDIIRFSQHPKIEARRILPLKDNGDEMTISEKLETCGKILSLFKGGLIILDDVNSYMVSIAHSEEVLSKIISNRHRSQDIIIQYQSLSAIDPRGWQNVGLIRLHYQIDDVYRYEKRIPVYDLVKIAQLLVNAKYFSGDIRFFVWVDMYSRKIYGKFDKKDFLNAIDEYKTLYPREVKGKSKAERELSLKKLNERLMQYYGN